MTQDFEMFVVAPTGRDGPLICNMLARAGIYCRLCSSVEELYGTTSAGLGGIILTEEALIPGAMEKLNAKSST